MGTTRLSRRAQKDLEGMAPGLSEKAMQIIGRLDNEPALGKKLLGGLQGLRSARLGRSYRIIYLTDEVGVVVVTVRPRKDSYK